MHKALQNLAAALTIGDFNRHQLIYCIITVLAPTSVMLGTIISKTSPEFTNQSNSTNNAKELWEIEKNNNVVYGKTTLPLGIRSRFVKNINGLTIHILEAGFEVKDRPCVLLLHGFPELG